MRGARAPPADSSADRSPWAEGPAPDPFQITKGSQFQDPRRVGFGDCGIERQGERQAALDLVADVVSKTVRVTLLELLGVEDALGPGGIVIEVSQCLPDLLDGCLDLVGGVTKW